MCEKERKMGQNNVEDMKNMEMKDQTVQSMTLHLMENRKAYGYTTWGCMWEKGAVSRMLPLMCTQKTVQKIK